MLNVWPVNTKPLLDSDAIETKGPVVAPDGPRTAWPFAIAWPPSGQTIQERYRYLTEIHTSRSGREKRSARRSIPRKRVEFSCVLHDGALAAWQAFIHRRLVENLVIPQAHLSRTLPAEMPQGTDAIYLEDSPDWMLPDMAIVIGEGPQRETLTIEAVFGDLNYFNAGSQRSWPAGTPVYAGLTGVLDQAHDAELLTAMVARLGVTFHVRPLSEPAPAPAAPGLTFNGREVFLLRPNWAQPLSQSWVRPVDELDYGTGPTTRYSPVPFAADTLQATYVGANRDEVQAILDLFHRARGRQGEFYAPTWLPDLTLREGLTAGADTLRVQGTQTAEVYANSRTHRALYVRLRGGQVLLRRVVSIATIDDAQGQDAVITVDSVWADNVPMGQVVMAGWLLLRRFASDDLTVEWQTSAVATVTFGMLALESLAAEEI